MSIPALIILLLWASLAWGQQTFGPANETNCVTVGEEITTALTAAQRRAAIEDGCTSGVCLFRAGSHPINLQVDVVAGDTLMAYNCEAATITAAGTSTQDFFRLDAGGITIRGLTLEYPQAATSFPTGWIRANYSGGTTRTLSFINNNIRGGAASLYIQGNFDTTVMGNYIQGGHAVTFDFSAEAGVDPNSITITRNRIEKSWHNDMSLGGSKDVVLLDNLAQTGRTITVEIAENLFDTAYDVEDWIDIKPSLSNKPQVCNIHDNIFRGDRKGIWDILSASLERSNIALILGADCDIYDNIFYSGARQLQIGNDIAAGAGSIYRNVFASRLNEGQTWAISSGDATGGTYTLTWNGETTGAIAYNASAATVQTALEGLSNLESGDVRVVAVDPNTQTGYVMFYGRYEWTNVAAMTGSGASLTGPSSPYTITVATPEADGGIGYPGGYNFAIILSNSNGGTFSPARTDILFAHNTVLDSDLEIGSFGNDCQNDLTLVFSNNIVEDTFLEDSFTACGGYTVSGSNNLFSGNSGDNAAVEAAFSASVTTATGMVDRTGGDFRPCQGWNLPMSQAGNCTADSSSNLAGVAVGGITYLDQPSIGHAGPVPERTISGNIGGGRNFSMAPKHFYP